MGRAPRQHAPGCIYHVTLRGNHAAAIFDRARHYEVLDEIVGDVLLAGRAVAHAYCWMPNHIHLLLQVQQVSSARLMHDIGGRYSRYLQGERGTRGQLFDRRYFAQLVDTDGYLVAATGYIHLNPVRAGIVTAARDYRWSGQRAYAGGPGPRWLQTELVLKSLAASPAVARAAYLARTEGEGASALPSPFKKAGAPDVHRRISTACAARGVTLEALRHAAWNRPMVELRAEIAAEIAATDAVTLRRLAGELGCSPAALSRSMARHGLKPRQM